MKDLYRLRRAWGCLKEYALAVIAAGLLFAGIGQLLGMLNYALPTAVIGFINFIIRTGFRDRILLAAPGWLPWQYYAIAVPAGVIFIVLGVFVGLWANTMERHRQASA